MIAAASPVRSISQPVSRASRLADRYLLWLGITLAGYGCFGRGFAYVGIPPLFIGEAMMLTGIALLCRAKNWSRLWERPQIIALCAFVLFGIARTIPYIDRYGLDAVRDGAIYYYSAFAFVVAGLLISEPTRLLTLLDYYRRYARVFIFIIPCVLVVCRFGHNALPHWPWGDAAIVQMKEGDAMVQLGGIVAFWMSGLAGQTPTFYSIVLAIDAACIGVIDRAGMVAFSVAMALGMAHRPSGKVGWKMIGAMLGAAILLGVSGFHMEIPGGKGRQISFQQIVTNVRSTFGDVGSDGLDSTKEWRMNWWKDILQDTLHGRYFWDGKGFGINLADYYGYQVGDKSLRSPHNAQMTILARMGVPGLVLWIAVQGTMGLWLMNAYYKSRRSGDDRWSGLFLFIFAFWLAFLINACFDVFLEGPMGGIWFWSVYGFGVGTLWIFERYPEVLYPMQQQQYETSDEDDPARLSALT